MHHRLDGGHHGGAFFVITVVGLQSQVTINLIERIGAFTRDMSAINLGLAAILSIAVIWLYAQTRMQPLVIALAFVMVGGALGLNVQVLTGYDAQHWMHFTNRIIQPLFFLLLVRPSCSACQRNLNGGGCAPLLRWPS